MRRLRNSNATLTRLGIIRYYEILFDTHFETRLVGTRIDRSLYTRGRASFNINFAGKLLFLLLPLSRRNFK